jgi:hypothetical protein
MGDFMRKADRWRIRRRERTDARNLRSNLVGYPLFARISARLILLPALLLVVSIAATPAFSTDVALAWDANSEADLAGYKVYYGTSSRNYSNVINVGKVTTYTVASLGPGTYFFAVTAYNTSNAESGFSNEVSKAITGSVPCDISLDNLVNVVDIQVLINVILGITACPGGCDINGDATVNVVDLQTLQNVILGVRTCP